MRLPPARRLGAIAILTVVLAATAPDARADVRLFRPLTADPRECQSRWRMSRYVEDWRYGTDVTDSTSRGGVVHDRVGISWEVSAGEVFRWMPLERCAVPGAQGSGRVVGALAEIQEQVIRVA